MEEQKKQSRWLGVRVAVITAVAGALIVGAGGGAAVSAALITSAQIKDGTIQSIDVRNDTLKSGDIKNGTVKGADVADGSIAPRDLSKAARTYWAVVDGTGTLSRSSGGVTTSRITTGSYEVLFPTDVTQCAYVATKGNAGAGNPARGFLVVAARSGNPNGVFVEVRTTGDALVDASFHLVVDC